MMPALSAKNVAACIAVVVTLVVAASYPAHAVNDNMTALNNRGDVAFVESPGEDVNDNAGVSLKVLRNGSKTVVLSNGDPLRAHCYGGSNISESCNNDTDCPSGECVQPVVAGFARRVCMNDDGLITTRVGGVNPDGGFRCEDGGPGANFGAPCTSDADCTVGGTCTDDPDTEAAIVTVGLGKPKTIIAQSCDKIGSDVVNCPDTAPDINNAGQVAFTANMTNDANLCDDDFSTSFCRDQNLPPGSFYATYRFTPGTGIEEMLRVGDVINAATVTVVDQDNTDYTDDPDSESHMNAKGQILAMPRINNGNTNDLFVDMLVILNGPGDRTEVAREVPGAGNINVVEKGVMNSATPTQVLHKTIDDSITTGPEKLVLFTQGDGSTTIAAEGDSIPNGGTFNGFGRFFCLNDAGQAAFVAGINSAIPVSCSDNEGGDCDPQPQGLFFYSGGNLTEIARTESAGGTGTTSFNGFDFEWFGNAVVINEAGTVCFTAEHINTTQENSRNEPSALFCWDQATGIREIFRDGNFVAGSADTALVGKMETFKRVLNERGDLAFPVDPTAAEGDDPDDDFVLFTTFGQARAAAPALSTGVMILAVVLMVALGARLLRRRRSA